MAVTLEAGDQAPPFDLLDQDGTRHRLSDYRGRTVVLYFYPKDDTPGCTTQACSLRDHFAEIAAAGAVILGVSTDSASSHQRATLFASRSAARVTTAPAGSARAIACQRLISCGMLQKSPMAPTRSKSTCGAICVRCRGRSKHCPGDRDQQSGPSRQSLPTPFQD